MRKSLIICSFLILSSFQSSNAEIYKGYMVPLLTTPASVRAQALGNAGVTDVGTGSHTINPASLALRGENGFVSVSFFPTKAVVRSILDDIGFNFYGISAVISPSKNENSSNIAIGLAINYYKMDFSVIYRTDALGNRISNGVEAFDETYNGTLSLATKGKYQFGVGLTIRYFKSVLLNSDFISGYLFDSGFLLKRSFGRNRLDQQKRADSFWRVTPAIGISVLNIGSNQSYNIFLGGDSPPKTTRVGTSVAIDLIANNHAIISIVPLFEAEKLQFPDRAYVWHFGGEVGYQELVYLLIGKFNDQDNNVRQTTWGFRFSTEGVSNLLGNTAEVGTNSTLLSHISLDISYANYVKDQSSLLSDTQFLNLSATYEF